MLAVRSGAVSVSSSSCSILPLLLSFCPSASAFCCCGCGVFLLSLFRFVVFMLRFAWFVSFACALAVFRCSYHPWLSSSRLDTVINCFLHAFSPLFWYPRWLPPFAFDRRTTAGLAVAGHGFTYVDIVLLCPSIYCPSTYSKLRPYVFSFSSLSLLCSFHYRRASPHFTYLLSPYPPTDFQLSPPSWLSHHRRSSCGARGNCPLSFISEHVP